MLGREQVELGLWCEHTYPLSQEDEVYDIKLILDSFNFFDTMQKEMKDKHLPLYKKSDIIMDLSRYKEDMIHNIQYYFPYTKSYSFNHFFSTYGLNINPFLITLCELVNLDIRHELGFESFQDFSQDVQEKFILSLLLSVNLTNDESSGEHFYYKYIRTNWNYIFKTMKDNHCFWNTILRVSLNMKRRLTHYLKDRDVLFEINTEKIPLLYVWTIKEIEEV